MDPRAADLIDTLVLHSDRCQALLKQALEREEAAENRQQLAYSHRPTNADSSDSEGVEAPSSSSDEEETEETAQSDPTVQSVPTIQPNGTTTTAPPLRPKTKTPKPTLTDQQLLNSVKKFVENLVCNALQINDDEAIHLSTSLLSKPQESLIAERNYIPQSPCQEYLALSESLATSNVLVILLRSGRFAAGIFRQSKCLVHRACQRYTVRRGQGKAQSTQDGNRRPKSMGAQLRRAGEENLQEDIRSTIRDWKPHIQSSATSLILLSCPKAMKKYLFEALEPIIGKDDPRLRRLPLDTGRPTFENVSIAHQVMMTVPLRRWVPPSQIPSVEEVAPSQPVKSKSGTSPTAPTMEQPEVVFPLTPLHEACQKGNLAAIGAWLENPQQILSCLDERGQETDITVEQALHRRVGPDFMTCLHYAAAGDGNGSDDFDALAASVRQLLLLGKADPSRVDARSRPPYFLAGHDKIRDAFRLARATLGEDYCQWDAVAKVGPPLTAEDIEAKKEREAEKKRKKKARQKQKKAEEKTQTELEQKKREEAEEARRKEEDAKRVRDGLQPKVASAGGSVCDFCQTVVKGRKRKDMFSRLEYVYCSPECVQKHKRELMAAAALKRFGG